MDEIVFEEPVVYNSDNSATQSAINAVGRLLLLVAKKLEIPDTEINRQWVIKCLLSQLFHTLQWMAMVSVRSHFLGWGSRKKNQHCTTVGCHIANKCQWNLDFVCDSCYSRFRSDASINFDCRYSVCRMLIATFVRVAEVMIGRSLIGVVVAPLLYVRTVMNHISIFPLGVGE